MLVQAADKRIVPRSSPLPSCPDRTSSEESPQLPRPDRASGEGSPLLPHPDRASGEGSPLFPHSGRSLGRRSPLFPRSVRAFAGRRTVFPRPRILPPVARHEGSPAVDRDTGGKAHFLPRSGLRHRWQGTLSPAMTPEPPAASVRPRYRPKVAFQAAPSPSSSRAELGQGDSGCRG